MLKTRSGNVMDWIRTRTMNHSLNPASGRNEEAPESTAVRSAVNSVPVILALLALSGCIPAETGDGVDALDVRELAAGNWCGEAVAGATWLDDAVDGDARVLRVSMGRRTTG